MRPDQVAQSFIQSDLENLRGYEDCTTPLGNLFQGLIVFTIKKLFPVSSQNLSCDSVVGNTFCHVGPGISGALSTSDF